MGTPPIWGNLLTWFDTSNIFNDKHAGVLFHLQDETGPKSDAKAAATETNVPPWSLWFIFWFAVHSKTSARTPNIWMRIWPEKRENDTHTHTSHTHCEFPLSPVSIAISAMEIFIVKAGLEEMDNVVLRLEVQIRWGCLWMQIDDWISGFARKIVTWDRLRSSNTLQTDVSPSKQLIPKQTIQPSWNNRAGMGEYVTFVRAQIIASRLYIVLAEFNFKVDLRSVSHGLM